jgi:hypothetical protein
MLEVLDRRVNSSTLSGGTVYAQWHSRTIDLPVALILAILTNPTCTLPLLRSSSCRWTLPGTPSAPRQPSCPGPPTSTSAPSTRARRSRRHWQRSAPLPLGWMLHKGANTRAWLWCGARCGVLAQRALALSCSGGSKQGESASERPPCLTAASRRPLSNNA